MRPSPSFSPRRSCNPCATLDINHTTSALCEHVDNAYQAGASEIRIFFRQASKREGGLIDVAVYDNGKGMAPAVLKAATAFGGSLNFGNRDGIGRFGMGMKTAALSLSPIMELYSWQEPKAIYSMTLDIDAIGRYSKQSCGVARRDLEMESFQPSRPRCSPPSCRFHPITANNIPVPRKARKSFTIDMGPSGTLVYMPACDRLTYAKPKTLVEHAMKEMARVYRRQIAAGLNLYVNNRFGRRLRSDLLDAECPAYSFPGRRKRKDQHLGGSESKVNIPISEGQKETARPDPDQDLQVANRGMVEFAAQDAQERSPRLRWPDRFDSSKRSRGFRGRDGLRSPPGTASPIGIGSRSTSQACSTKPSAWLPTSRGSV